MKQIDWGLWAVSLKNGQSQLKTAKRLGISQGALCHMIFSGVSPSIATLAKIAEARGVSVWELVKEAEDLTQSGTKKADHSSKERSA
jgi:transcriptional regulator with XRE-family HTH domain